MSIIDPIFQQIPKNSKACFLIWRVEKMQLTNVPKESHGTFFKGDTYIVYYANETRNDQHIHLWIGNESTKDEQGIGAFKMVELDDYLGGTPVQHRESQGYESERFLSYYKKQGGISYQNGGCSSGFNHYEKNYDPHMYLVKGKHNVRFSELPTIDWSAMNRSDTFIIDFYSVIFVWNGKNANKTERIQAVNKAQSIRTERNSKCNIVVVEDGDEKNLNKDEIKIFETKLPLKDKLDKLKANESVVDDLKFEREASSYLKLYICTDTIDDNGTVKIKIIEQKMGPLFKDDLLNDASYIVDNGKAGIWVWIGRKSSQKERQEAMRNALGFLQAKGFNEKLQNAIKVTRVIEGAEPTEFKSLFNKWYDGSEQKGLGKTYTTNSIAKVLQTKFDAAALHHLQQAQSDNQVIDDGKGEKHIWFVQNFEIYNYQESAYGKFHTGDCYIIQYKYMRGNVESYILYYWIGRKSTKDEQGTAVLKTIELDKRLNDKAVQVRVNEGKEPKHFMSIFGGQLIIYQGGKASGFRNDADSIDTDKLSDSYMLQIRTYGPGNTKAIQVDMKASLLNSNDVFIIYTKPDVFIWCGLASTGDERQVAKQVSNDLNPEPEMIFEGQEKNEFWDLLGGKETYAVDKRTPEHIAALPNPRLFELSNATGKVNVEEIFQFTQDDLNPSDVMILDAWDTVFIWIGSESTKSEANEAEHVAFEYLSSDPSNRGTDIPVYKVKQGNEPQNFTALFGVWDADYFNKSKDYTTLVAEIHAKNDAKYYLEEVKKDKPKQTTQASVNFADASKYSYLLLCQPIGELPKDVNPEARELHLSDEDFVIVFKMTHQEFVHKPVWKQKELKRSVKLF